MAEEERMRELNARPALVKAVGKRVHRFRGIPFSASLRALGIKVIGFRPPTADDTFISRDGYVMESNGNIYKLYMGGNRFILDNR